jgi:hypothetical protein
MKRVGEKRTRHLLVEEDVIDSCNFAVDEVEEVVDDE